MSSAPHAVLAQPQPHIVPPVAAKSAAEAAVPTAANGNESRVLRPSTTQASETVSHSEPTIAAIAPAMATATPPKQTVVSEKSSTPVAPSPQERPTAPNPEATRHDTQSGLDRAAADGDPSSHLPTELFIGILVAAGLVYFQYANSAGTRARRTLDRAIAQFDGLLAAEKDVNRDAEAKVTGAAREYVAEVQAAWLAAVPIEQVRQLISGVRMQPLLAAGKTRLIHCHGWTAAQFQQYRGIGPDSAAKLAHACTLLSRATLGQDLPYPELGGRLASGSKMYGMIFAAANVSGALGGLTEVLQAHLDAVKTIRKSVYERTTFARWILSFQSDSPVHSAVLDASKVEERMKEGGDLGCDLADAANRLAAARSWIGKPIDYGDLQTHVASNEEFYAQRISVLLGIQPTSAVRPVPPQLVAASVRGNSSSGYSIREPQRVVSPTRVPQQPISRPVDSGGAGLCWVPFGNRVSVGRFEFQGGLYMGKRLRAVRQDFIEPALVDPDQPIQEAEADCHVRMLTYWPSYAYATPAARASYLQWLADGKSDPEADVGYVFLYFYGLERRALVDAANDAEAAGELDAIVREIERLRSIYAGNRSFDSYSSSLLEFLTFSQLAARNEIGPPPPLRRARASTTLKLGLARIAMSQSPLPPDWAFTWYYNDPRSKVPSSLQRRPNEAAALFRSEYGRVYGDGIVLPVNKTKLKVVHRPASGSFVNAVEKTTDLPDVSALNGPFAKIETLAVGCGDQLAAFSRFAARNPGQERSLDAMLLLPTSLWPESIKDRIAGLRTTTDGTPERATSSYRQLLSALGGSVALSKGKYVALCQALDALHVGIEPDLRYGGTLPELDDPIVIFAADGPTNVGNGFPASALLLELGCTIAAADGDFSDAEADKLKEHFDAQANLTPAEKQRLMARMCVYRAKPRPIAALKRMVDGVDPAVRPAVLDFLFMVVHADGVVAPAEIKAMEKVYQLFGLNVATVYSRLHGVAAAPTEIAPTNIERVGAIALDRAKVEKLLADSAAVTAKLHVIFDDSEAKEAISELATVETQDEPEQPSEALLGLDAAHSELLAVLLGRPQWTKAAFIELCQENGLMVDGAIETINGAAYDKFNEPIIDGDDPIEISSHLLQQAA